MNLEKLFGSKTKVDILKYLLFKRQGISMRALESEIERTFPAIKKQVDSLDASNVINVNKDGAGFAISIKPEFHDILKNVFYFWLQNDLKTLFTTYEVMIDQYYFGKKFNVDLEMDLVVIYKNCEKPQIDMIKQNIDEIFRKYFIESASVVFMGLEERQKRDRLADRFVILIKKSLTKK
jgi:predicted transcriptional regulator